jgi:hypothetical protein
MAIDALSGLGNIDRQLEINATQRKSSPSDVDLMAEQIRLQVLKGAPATKIARDEDEFIKRYGSKESAADLQLWRDYFDGAAAYAKGDANAFGAKTASLPGDINAFQSAFCLGKYQDAAAALDHSKTPFASGRLLLYLAGKSNGEDAFAEKQLNQALAEMEKSRTADRKAAACLRNGDNLTPESIENLKIPIEVKRILVAAIGIRYPQLKEPCFRFAAQLNRDPHFPYLFLKGIVGEAPEALAGQ